MPDMSPTDHHAERAVFQATLTPHRSATPQQQLLVILLVIATIVPAGVVFVIAGAWPVTGFMGLEIVLLFFAFKINQWQSIARQVIQVSRARFRLMRTDTRGRTQHWEWTPAWIQVLVADSPKRKNQLEIRSHGETVEIGEFLTADERVDLAKNLRHALAGARF